MPEAEERVVGYLQFLPVQELEKMLTVEIIYSFNCILLSRNGGKQTDDLPIH